MQKEKILSIKNFRSLIKFLSNQLNWPIDVEGFEDFESLTYEFNPKELGIKEEYLSKIKKIKQLRPVEENPFAIFWIEFESKNLPILALRRILNKFVEKKRELTDTVKWPLNEILFVTSHTNKNNKAITFAQFRKTKNKETLREFWWDEREVNFGYIVEKLTFLKWPEDNKSKKEWVKNWSQAFDGSIRETIKDSKQLAAY